MANNYGSLSARRAWIEIVICRTCYPTTSVALRKESVDRNHAVQVIIVVVDTSLSARRAWIEILFAPGRGIRTRRSLSARRAWIEIDTRN